MLFINRPIEEKKLLKTQLVSETIMDTNLIIKLLEMHYEPKNELELSELEKIAKEATEGLNTINGDTATVEISVRQFILLLQAWYKNNIG